MGTRIAIALFAFWTLLNAAQAQQRATIFPQLGHAWRIQSVAYSPDGTRIASASPDHTVKLWEAATGRLIMTLTGHAAAVNAVAFSPDGKMLASGGFDTKILLWDTASGRQLGVLSAQPQTIDSVAFSPDGTMLASGSVDHSITLWDVAGAHALRSLVGHSGAVGSVMFSPDGKTLASTGYDRTVRLWDVASGQTIKTLGGNENLGFSLAFSPDGKSLAAGVLQNSLDSIKIWDVASGKERLTLAGHPQWIWSLAFSPDGWVLASGSRDHTAKLWNAASGQLLQTLSGHTDDVTSVAFSPDSKTLISGSWDATIKVWDADSGRELRTVAGRTAHLNWVAVSPDNRILAAASWDRTVKLWDRQTGLELRALTGHSNIVDSVAFAPDGKTIAAGSDDNTVIFWDVASGRIMRSLTGSMGSIAFSHSGMLLASASSNDIKLWDVASGRELRTLSGHTDTIWRLSFSPDDSTLASSSKDHTIKLWDVASGHALRTLTGHSGSVSSVEFSPDGKTLASGSDDSTVRLWDAATGRQLKVVSGAPSGFAFTSVAFSPNGRSLAAGSDDSTVKLWDLASGSALNPLVGNASHVQYVAFSPDGKTLASAGDDGTSRIWDVTTGAERAAMIGFNDGSSLAVTPEGFFESSSEQAEENLNVRIGDRVFGISSFRENFYRPDVVQKALAGEDISQFGSIDKVQLSPVVQFAGDTPSTTKDAAFKFSLNLTNGGGGFGPVRLFWNGTVIQQDVDVPVSGDTLSRNYTMPLLSGDNALRATAFNADGSMWSEAETTVTAELPPPSRAAGAHGTLHAIVVGVQEFPGAVRNNLAYPYSDAKLIADTLTAKAGPLFDRLDVQLFNTPTNTDKASIVSALRKLEAAAGPSDEFVFYAASHGVIAKNGQYYLMASNATSADPASLATSAISAKELSTLLANIHVARKLVILDTCDAGNASATLKANGGLRAKDAATILGRDFGFTVLAATTTDQEALESPYKEHGLFSYVVADGLAGKAADPSSGVVTSFVLADYVNDNVPTLAQTALHRSQQPTAEKSGQSFPVTKVK